MEKSKAFYDKNKKIIIPVAILLVVLMAVGMYFISQPTDNTDKKAENSTEQKVEISQEDKKEEDKNGVEQSTDNAAHKPSDDKEVSDHNAENSENNNSGSSNNGGGNNSSSKPSTPTHTHHWKEHTVTIRVWVSKIVPVYETQKVQVGVNEISEGEFWHCNCGAVIPMSEYDDHISAHLNADEPSNGYPEEHFRKEPIYEEKQVQVGTKDESHYETHTYVDYKYCDCGAKK